MIEVRNTAQAASTSTPAPASTKGPADVREKGGKELPPQVENKSADKASREPLTAKQAEQKLDSAVAKVSEFVQSIQRDIEFTVDKDLNETVIRVTDRDSGELIRQIPEEVFLELARKLKEDGELQLVNALG